MKIPASMILALLALTALAGCESGAREVDYSQQRAISSDINASLDHGPTAMRPGMTLTEEPIGAFPWTIGESRQ